MKSGLQNFIIWIGSFLPYRIGHLIYLLPLWKLKVFLFLLGLSAWARNSVHFKEEVFGLSDIDITIYAQRRIAPWKIIVILFYLKLLRIFFPFVGEVVILEGDEIGNYISLASQIELKRDPILLKHLDGGELGSDLRTAFILKWIFNDYHRMDQGILKRKNKIDRFRKLLKLPGKSYFSAEDLLMDLLKDFISDEQKREQWFAVLQRFLRAYRIEKKPINIWLEEHRDYEEVLALCYPQVWMGAAIHAQSFYDMLYHLKGLPAEDKNIFREQISWELWGLYSNHLFVPYSSELILHLDHLKECVSVVLEDHDLLLAVENLRGLYESA